MAAQYQQNCPAHILEWAERLARDPRADEHPDVEWIGEGVTSVVYGIDEYAIKVYKPSSDPTAHAHEGEMLLALQHDPLMVPCYGYETGRFLITRRIRGVSANRYDGPWDPEWVTTIAHSILHAVSMGALYKGVREQDIMVEDGKVFLIDVASYEPIQSLPSMDALWDGLRGSLSELLSWKERMNDRHLDELTLLGRLNEHLPFFDEDRYSVLVEGFLWEGEQPDPQLSQLMDLSALSLPLTPEEFHYALRRKRREVYSKGGLHVVRPDPSDILFLATIQDATQFILFTPDFHSYPDVIKAYIQDNGIEVAMDLTTLNALCSKRLEDHLKKAWKAAVQTKQFKKADRLKTILSTMASAPKRHL